VSARTPALVRWATTLAAVAVGLTACGSEPTSIAASDAPPVTAEPATSVPVGESAGVWVAVLDTAADPGRLNAPRRDVLHELGDVLEGSVVISPGACLEGLPADMTDGYVLAIQRESREDVRALVSQLSQQPSFTGDVTIVCSD
jgi:hypothetical protein